VISHQTLAIVTPERRREIRQAARRYAAAELAAALDEAGDEAVTARWPDPEEAAMFSAELAAIIRRLTI
jgi:hypothetical protein